MSDGMGREPAYLSSHATNRYFIPNWGSCMPVSKPLNGKDDTFDLLIPHETPYKNNKNQ